MPFLWSLKKTGGGFRQNYSVFRSSRARTSTGSGRRKTSFYHSITASCKISRISRLWYLFTGTSLEFPPQILKHSTKGLLSQIYSPFRLQVENEIFNLLPLFLHNSRRVLYASSCNFSFLMKRFFIVCGNSIVYLVFQHHISVILP